MNPARVGRTARLWPQKVARPYTETLCIFSKQKVSDLSIIPSKIEAYEASQLLSAKASLKSKSIPQGKPVSRWDLRAKKTPALPPALCFCP
jgi:hypothetical protein